MLKKQNIEKEVHRILDSFSVRYRRMTMCKLIRGANADKPCPIPVILFTLSMQQLTKEFRKVSYESTRCILSDAYGNLKFSQNS